jgi:hypothetical protein
MTLASRGRMLAGCVLLALPVAIALPGAVTPEEGLAASARQAPQAGAAPPNIVLMFPDNIGVGEVGVYGGNRGVRRRVSMAWRARACG